MPPKERKPPADPRPSASVLLISPDNQILLLQRVQHSSAFPSAHVFPGGNVSTFHDGEPPAPDAPDRHEDSDVYRLAALRETFEESGILLARNNGFGRLIEAADDAREAGRHAVHADKIAFPRWCAQHGGRPDLQGLIPFTRWITPANLPKRFTTQMYLYFLPTAADSSLSATGTRTTDDNDESSAVLIPPPTTDGGKEHTQARFLPASTWLQLAQEGRVILFPPQFFLLHQVAQFLDGLPSPSAYAAAPRDPVPRAEMEARRRALRAFTKTGEPAWTHKCICPQALPARDGQARADGRSVLGLHRPGPELEGRPEKRAGITEQCVLVQFRKEGPRKIAVISREEALAGAAAKM